MDGPLGSYGHWLGVNWVWSTGVVAFHLIFSLGLPILLLGLALPETRGRSLVGPRGIGVALGTVALSTAVESLLVAHTYGFWIGVPLLVGAVGVVVVFLLLGWLAPREWRGGPSGGPGWPRWALGLLGFALFPILLIMEYGSAASGPPAALCVGAELVVIAAFLVLARRAVGHPAEPARLVALAFGFLLWQSLFGLLLTIGLPYTLPLVAVVGIFFVRMFRAYPMPAAPRTVPPGAVGLRDVP